MARPHHRSKRLMRQQKKGMPTLNLVSLMDIFTILVFFLLVNSSNVQQPSGDGLRLPEAKVETPITESLLIQVNAESIIVQGRKVADVTAQLLASEDPTIAPLVEELTYLAGRERLGNKHDPASEERSATLMADRDIPFKLLKKIMASASQANYGQLSLAVIGKAQDKD